MRAYLIAGGGREPDRPTGREGPFLIRVERMDAADLDERLTQIARFRPDAIVLPASHGRDIVRLGARLAVIEAELGIADGGIGIVALVTSAAGALAAASFVDTSPRLHGIGWDAVLSVELGARALTDDGAWSPALAQVRSLVRLAAAAAGVEAIEAAYPEADTEGLDRLIAAARRDGFAAMFARDAIQAERIRSGA